MSGHDSFFDGALADLVAKAEAEGVQAVAGELAERVREWTHKEDVERLLRRWGPRAAPRGLREPRIIGVDAVVSGARAARSTIDETRWRWATMVGQVMADVAEALRTEDWFAIKATRKEEPDAVLAFRGGPATHLRYQVYLSPLGKEPPG